MRVDLLESIVRKTEATNVVILTHNIDLIFFQNVVIPSLRKCGHPSVTVFADSICATDSFERQGKWIDGIGRRYRVVPVSAQPGFRFHPKAVFVSGFEKASLFIGSGNVGFGGWRENAEIWNKYNSDSDDSGVFNAFMDYLNQIADRVPLNDSILEEVWEAFDPTTREWSGNMNPPVSIIGKVDGGDNLIDQMADVLGNQFIDKLIICAPYFDLKGEMINELSDRFNAKSTEVLVQPQSTNLTQSAANNFKESVTLKPITFIGQDETQSFLHAKYFAFQYGEVVTVFSGSANCSKAALIIPGSRGNVELMSYSTMPLDTFGKEYLNEIKFLEESPELKENIEEENEESVSYGIQILGCRYDIGVLHIAYIAGKSIKISKCIVDGNPVDIKIRKKGTITVNIRHGPSKVVLEGKAGQETITSNVGWVDHEMELRATSHQRRLANSIHKGVNSMNWNISVWNDILSLFHQHIKYLPKKTFSIRSTIHNKIDSKTTSFSIEDIFTQDYGLPRKLVWHGYSGGSDRLEGLQSILLRWFGIGLYKEELEEKENDANEVETDGEEAVDVAEKIVVKPSDLLKRKPTDREKKRVVGTISMIVEALTDNNYLKERPIPQLSADLSIISLLLRSGLKEEWIADSEFLLFTHNIWSKLFFSSEVKLKSNDINIGWLEYRYSTCQDKDEFIEQLNDIRLSTAMTAWALALSEPTGLSEEAIFTISCGISIAKFPWLWSGYDLDKFAEELHNELIHTGELEPGDEQKWDTYCKKRENLIGWGFALRKLEKELKDISPGNIKDKISRKIVKRGELLWQGGDIGLCIAGQDCNRVAGGKIIVHCLQHAKLKRAFSSSYIIPIESIITENLITQDILTESEKNTIISLLERLTENLKDMN